LVLFSGGLDSILACKVLEQQGVRVRAIQFATPFFFQELLEKQDEERQRVYEHYGIVLELIDITDEYLEMVTGPEYGYGRYLNPCIDCRILMVRKALSLMKDFGAGFLATGEVLGQRPMSQRRDALRTIERDSGAEGLLLRPLSAAFFTQTIPEKAGLVDRKRLHAISGRSRRPQMELAESFGIRNYPAPAGGCVLADPVLSKRFRKIFKLWPGFSPGDCLLAKTGRHFLLKDKGWLAVGRNQKENRLLMELLEDNDILLKAISAPGPVSILRYSSSGADMETAARITARYSKYRVSPCRIGARRGRDGFQKCLDISGIVSEEELESYRF